MQKRITLLLTAILLVTILVGCAPAATPVAPAAPAAANTEAPAASTVKTPVKVVFLLTQPLSPFEEDIWKAINKAKDDGIASEVKLIEMKSPTEYEQTTRQVSEQGYNVVISAFFFVHEAFNKVAPDFPKTDYIMVYEPNDKEIPNIHGILYDVQEGSYVCGVVAAKMSKTNRVGFIGGDNNPGIVKFLAGYEAGLKSVNPNIQIDTQFAGTFIDPDKGHEIALALFEKGDDVVMHAANMTGLGLFDAAKEKNMYAIGVDIDQSNLAPNNVICSALSSPGLSIYGDLVAAASGTWKGGTSNWGTKDGAPAAAISSIVPADVVAAAEQAEKDIASGKIVPPQTTVVK
jgi:basic membrane protein A and related proteins